MAEAGSETTIWVEAMNGADTLNGTWYMGAGNGATGFKAAVPPYRNENVGLAMSMFTTWLPGVMKPSGTVMAP